MTVEELWATFDEKYFVTSIPTSSPGLFPFFKGKALGKSPGDEVASILLFRPSNTVIRTSVYMYVYIADSIKDALGIGKLLFGGHSSK